MHDTGLLRPRMQRGWLILAVAVDLITAVPRIAAQDAMRPRLQTNESYVETVTRATTLGLKDPLSVFAFVLDSLPERVKVYPTENYYYFNFVHRGVPYDGNIRLDASDRDEGKVHFAYAETLSDWREETPVTHVVLDASKGVGLEKLGRFEYRLTYRGKSVLFALNDLSQIRPPPNALGPDESFVGPIFDESGIRFFLIYNARLRVFHYLLDETEMVADEFVPLRRTDRILVGKRTSYAFYRDRRRDRKILIGVYEGNSRLNNYFDGPFDQLPDNFIESETFRNILIQIEPRLKGEIDRFGGSPDGSQRYMIAPYSYYRDKNDLYAVHTCATSKRVAASEYYKCFVFDEDKESRGVSLPVALKKVETRKKR
jgi:hypothetical protein